MYAAADSTPLFLLATLDYVRSSGDMAFLTAHRDAIEKAWAFETSHAPDSAHGGNGIYENTQGTGWVESWPGGMPHQEIYLAALDQQASAAMAQIESLLGDKAKSDAAQARAAAIAKTIEEQFYDAQKDCYAFSRNADGSLDHTGTVYPALAWWSSPSVTRNAAYLAHPEGCLRQFAAHTLNTDWGLRDVSNEEKIYDGMSYHQGSVWPLFTGWAALAEYRGNQPLAGYQMLMENANLTWAQDLGADTELLSGDFFVPFGRSTSHQLWSSAMVITPTLRGLFGIDIDAQTKTITVNPHLPASWDRAKLLNLQVPGGKISLYFDRREGQVEISMSPIKAEQWQIRSDAKGASLGPLNEEEAKKFLIPAGRGLRIPLPTLEIDQLLTKERGRVGIPLPNQAPLPGDETSRFRILREDYFAHKLVLTIEGRSGSAGAVDLVRHALIVPHPRWQLEGASDTGTSYGGVGFIDTALSDPNEPMLLTFHFPPGEGWKTITVTLTW